MRGYKPLTKPFRRHSRDHRFFVRQEGHPLANIPLPRAVLPPFARKAEDTNAKRRDPTAHRGVCFQWRRDMCLSKRWWILLGKPRFDHGMVDEPLAISLCFVHLLEVIHVTIYTPKNCEDALLTHIFWMGLKPPLDHNVFLKVTRQEEKPWLFDVDSSSISIYKSFARKALQRSGKWSNVDMGKRFLWGHGDDTWRNEIKHAFCCSTGIFWDFI